MYPTPNVFCQAFYTGPPYSSLCGRLVLNTFLSQESVALLLFLISILSEMQNAGKPLAGKINF